MANCFPFSQRIRKENSWLWAMLCGMLSASSAFAQSAEEHTESGRSAEHRNVQEGLPLQIDSAEPVEYGVHQFQQLFQYDHLSDGRDRFFLEPRFKSGFSRGWEGIIGVPVLLGSADRTGSGNLRFEALHNFLPETSHRPGLGMSFRIDAPTGQDSTGIGTIVKLLVNRTLSEGPELPRLYLNAGWIHNAGRRGGQGDGDGYLAILGYSRTLNAYNTFVTDFVSEQQLAEETIENVFEVGVRHQLSERSVLSLGVGAGIGHDSPPIRALLGLQYGF